MAWRISFLVSGVSRKLKELGFWEMRLVGHLFEGLMLRTVELAMLVKKLLK